MFKTCDDCQSDFDIFKEGYAGVNVDILLCGKCWETEAKRRGIKTGAK
jgi:hypothetical protein